MLKKINWKSVLFTLWVYTLLVILWGAWVRISHSGDGCGDHWPLCDGKLIPEFNQHKTWVEYSHRLMSGFYGIVVFFVYFNFKNHLSKKIKILNLSLLILTISEALLGAVLVKSQLVTVNDSVLRLAIMSLHQLNSFLLSGACFLFYKNLNTDKNQQFNFNGANLKLVICFLLLPISGAIAALATTLFPTVSLWQGIIEDLSHESHIFIKLRVLHPLIASALGIFFIYWCFDKKQQRLGYEFTFAIIIGIITLITLSPIYLKIAHLLIAHLLWARVLQLLKEA